MKTPFELMFGESPITLPLSFKNTKYPAVEDRMHCWHWVVFSPEKPISRHVL